MNKNKFISLVYLYILLPNIVFILGWLNPVIGIISTVLLLFAYYLILKGNSKIEEIKKTTFLNRKNILILLGISLLWCYFAGLGGFYYQSEDHWARNAIFRDLIFNDWPVIYKNIDSMLNYYIGIWLIPSIFGKLVFLISGNVAVSWIIAKIFLLLWCTLGIFICFVLLAKVLSCLNMKKLIIAIVMFIFFSGMDIIGIYLLNDTITLHLEWWSGYQYSSFTTCLFWVYNQCIPAWIVTLLLLADSRVENFAFAGLCLLICSPLPFVGLFPIYIVKGIEQLIEAKKNKKIIDFVKKVFSIQNIIAVLIIFPIVLLYYKSNQAVSSNSDTLITNLTEYSSEQSFISVSVIKKVITLILFYVLEFGVYAIIVFKTNKKNPVFYCILLILLICPFIKVGGAMDFCMRASIPSLIILMTFVNKEFQTLEIKRNNTFIFLCVVLAISALTPIKEFYRGAYAVAKKHTIFLEYNTLNSIGDGTKEITNFISSDYKDTSFYKYLCK